MAMPYCSQGRLRGRRAALLTALVLMTGCGQSATSGPDNPAIAQPPPGPLDTTAALLAYFTSLSQPPRHILVGQHSDYWNSNPLRVVTPIQAATSRQVAILGVTNDQSGSTQDVVAVANAWLAQGGIVLVSQWPHNPLKTVGSSNFADVVTPGTAANQAWHSYLDAQIDKLKQIKGPVLWRPFVEVNGNWSWWVPNEDPAQFVTLWQQTYQYVASHGVSNVLWLFNLNTSDKTGGKAWYPGDSYVDVVSIDAYPPTVKQDTPVYNFLVSTGKPVMYAEAGVQSPNNSSVLQRNYDNSELLTTIKTSFPKVFAIVIFCQNYALPSQLGLNSFMNDPAVVTLGDLTGSAARGGHPEAH